MKRLRVDTLITSQRLKEAMSEAGINAQELSDRSGVGKSSISQYVNGSHAPSNITAYKIGKVLNVKPEWLMALGDTKRDTPDYVPGTAEIIDLYSRATPDQRKAVLNLLRSFVSE